MVLIFELGYGPRMLIRQPTRVLRDVASAVIFVVTLRIGKGSKFAR